MKLFRSHHKDYRDGEQSRDFIFVDDIADVMMYFMHNQKNLEYITLVQERPVHFLI
jgi:ADP-L-glycero-D-manno-heptose 6-epimerase